MMNRTGNRYGACLSFCILLANKLKNVGAIVHYAFTEMLNNAIDHSTTDRCMIEVRVDAAKVTFNVKDLGIGVFHSIAEKFDLLDEQTAMIELDMRDVTNVGQGFADEIFRVFASAHPEIEIRAINATKAVGAMIRHAQRSK